MLVSLLLGSFALTSCSVNPATGRRELSLVSEGQEIALGREADPQIVAQFGLYPDEELQRYIQELGAVLAAESERPHLPWTFRVLDDPLVNAFALPGGFIYVTRGILAHLSSEAELVGVLGHEIGHVTARHGASQMSRAMLAQVGLGIGAIAAPRAAQAVGGLAQTGIGLLFLKYGRDDEREADSLGLRYALEGGFDGRELAGVFDLLGRVSDAAGGQRAPGWASTHPAPENRAMLLGEQVADQPPGTFDGLRVDRNGYLRRLDGMTFGDDPRQGYFYEGVFYHPELALQLRFPEGWSASNTRQAVTAISAERDALVQLTFAAATDVDSAARDFLEQEGIEGRVTSAAAVAPFSSRRARFDVTNTEGSRTIAGWVQFFGRGEQVLQLLAIARADVEPRHRSSLSGTLDSFRRLTSRRFLEVEPFRVRIVTLDRDGTLDRQPQLRSAIEPGRMALLNDVLPGESLERGSLAKAISGRVAGAPR